MEISKNSFCEFDARAEVPEDRFRRTHKIINFKAVKLDLKALVKHLVDALILNRDSCDSRLDAGPDQSEI